MSVYPSDLHSLSLRWLLAVFICLSWSSFCSVCFCLPVSIFFTFIILSPSLSNSLPLFLRFPSHRALDAYSSFLSHGVEKNIRFFDWALRTYTFSGTVCTFYTDGGLKGRFPWKPVRHHPATLKLGRGRLRRNSL